MPFGALILPTTFGMRHVIVVEHVVSLRLVDFQAGQTLVQMQNEVVGEIFPSSPFIEPKVPLFLDRLRRSAIEDGVTFLRWGLVPMTVGQVFFQLGVEPPRSYDSCPNGHCKSPLVQVL